MFQFFNAGISVTRIPAQGINDSTNYVFFKHKFKKVYVKNRLQIFFIILKRIVKYIPPDDTKFGAGLSVVSMESGPSVTVSERKRKISGMHQQLLCNILIMNKVPPHLAPREEKLINSYCIFQGGKQGDTSKSL